MQEDITLSMMQIILELSRSMPLMCSGPLSKMDGRNTKENKSPQLSEGGYMLLIRSSDPAAAATASAATLLGHNRRICSGNGIPDHRCAN